MTGSRDTFEGLSEAERVAQEIEGWAWTWDAADNLRFEWAAPVPLSPARAAWREEFYRHWNWSFASGALQLVRIQGAAGGRKEWDSLPAFFAAPVAQRPRA